MLCLLAFILFVTIEHPNGQIYLYSDINLFDFATQFQPANMVELVRRVVVGTLTDCGQLCNGNVQCRTFDYDSHSSICRLFEGAVETGQVIPSGSSTSRVGSVRLTSNLFAAFGQPCAQCTNNRYLVCSTKTHYTCQCPQHTYWDGVECKNQGYEDANCSNDQQCRQDDDDDDDGLYLHCSNLHFCTKYRCGNMTIFKGDLPGNDLVQTNTTSFSTCCWQCQNYTGCVGFTWVSYSSVCYLKWSSGGGHNLSAYHISVYY